MAQRKGIFWGTYRAQLKLQNGLNYRKIYQTDDSYVLSPYSVIEEDQNSAVFYDIEKDGTVWKGLTQDNPLDGILEPPMKFSVGECIDKEAARANPYIIVISK